MYIHVLITLVTSSSIGTALAAPSLLRSRASSGNDNGGSSPMSIQPQIWIPLVVVAALFVLGTIVACSGRRLRRGALISWGNGAAQAAGVTTGTVPASGARELTADQLAGGNGTANTTANGNGTGTNRARRPRRARRTPSQISTHSLPAYMKEPGEQEIVIVRGADGMEDDIPITVEMPPVDEHGGDTPDGSLDLTRPSTVYSPVPHTANDVPLLHGSDLDSRQHLSADHPGMATRASFDSAISSADGSSQHYLDDAPAYETVILNDEPTAMAPSYPPAALATPAAQERTSTEQSGSTRRRSVFASIFNPRHSRGPSATATSSPPPLPPAASPEPRSSSGHTREGSGPSIMSVPAPDQRRSRMIRHQPSHSGSNSMFSLLSRTRSNGNINGTEGLTSPSLISLHSISAPLTHTLVKTELTYPKGGPTPEQLRLIASRENIVRFGMPYGPDAIAYAASSSRIDLEPPPGFEEVAGPSGAGSSPSPSPERDSPSVPGDGEDGGSPSVARPANDAVSEEPAAESPTTTSVATNAAVASEPAPPPPSHPIESAPVSDSGSTPASPPPAVSSPASPAESSTAAVSRSSPPPVQPPSASSASNSLSSRPAAPQTTSNAPPSAFKAAYATTPTGGSFPARATSRASSYMSYATAEESLHTPSGYDSQFDLSGREDDAYESAVETAPATPRIAPRHTHEETDTTVRG